MIRGELDVEYAIVHPQLCVEDGDRFLKDYIKPGAKYVIGACDPTVQRKMFKEAMAEVGASFDSQVIPIDLRNMETEQTFQKVKKSIELLQK